MPFFCAGTRTNSKSPSLEPVGRIAVVYGEPFSVEDAARGAERLAAALRSLTETAERLAVSGDAR